jgi:hypothetical protein
MNYDSKYEYDYEKKDLKYKTFTNSLVGYLTNTMFYFLLIGVPVILILFFISFFYEPRK